MRWPAEMLHVARKDARMARLPLAAYAAVLVLATVLAVRGSDASPAGIGWTFVVVITAMLAAAVLVQGDSPARADADWVTRPLRPSAVYGAKLLVMAGVLVVPGLTAQAIVLWSLEVPAPAYPSLLGTSAQTFALWLGLAAVVASLTRDLRSFVLGLLLVLVTGMLATSALFSRMHAQPEAALVEASAPPPGWQVLLLIGLLGIVAHQYVTRRVRRGAGLLAALAVAGLAAAAAPPLSSSSVRPPPPVSAALGAEPVVVGIDVVSVGDRSQAHVRVELAGRSAAHRYSLLVESAELHGTDGSVDTVGAGEFTVMIASGTVPLGATYAQEHRLSRIPVDLTAAQGAALHAGGARLVIRGHVLVRERTDVGNVPLAGGATLTRAGTRVKVLATSSDAGGPEIEVRQWHVELPGGGGSGWLSYRGPDVETSLVTAAGDTLELQPRGSLGGSGVLVLPGPPATVMTSRLRPVPGPGRAAPVPLEGAAVRVVLWRLVGSYPVVIDGG